MGPSVHVPSPLRQPGAHPEAGGTRFTVVTTTADDVRVRLFDEAGSATAEHVLERDASDTWSTFAPDVGPGTSYTFVLDGDQVPDPYARFLPRGVHGPAEVIAPARAAPLGSRGPVRSIYELHVGTFTPEGTYRGASARLDALVDLGVDAIELMPLAAFAGERGWGYDGVALYAPHAPYGRPEDLRAFVEAAHARGLAVLLDVVYNHFGPAGNYLARYAPEYFTRAIQTPWGDAPSFTWEPMRRLVLDNVVHWLETFGFDGLRLDATHAIHDPSPRHVLAEITELVHARGRLVYFEDERNEPSLVTETGADGIWADDFHHQVHVLLTGERDGYYAAYEPTVLALAKNVRDGFTYTGEPFVTWEGKPRGKRLGDVPRARLVTCVQNHDQVGNRARGDRLGQLVDEGAYAVAVMLSLFLPSTALLFMGQEWNAKTPFLFFSDHEGALGEAVTRGRREEFRHFASFAGEVPDPQARATFERSRLDWSERGGPILELHRAMLRLRRDLPDALDVDVDRGCLVVRRGPFELHVSFTSEARPRPAGTVLVASHPGEILAPRTAVLTRRPGA